MDSTAQALLFLCFRQVDTVCLTASVVSAANSANLGGIAVNSDSVATETDPADSEVTGTDLVDRGTTLNWHRNIKSNLS